ncbi:MAG: 16S rRNA (cytosine(1402)-N(4))-methyltransferase RsmH [Dongiaceae bacterium]
MSAAPVPQAATGGHRPVMLREVLQVLAPRDGGIYVDGTFGAGGYSRALLDAANCTVWGVDRDPDAIAAGVDLVRLYAGRLTLVPGRFGELARLLRARGVVAMDGIAFDVGVSSMQIDHAERGFSFRLDGPLDMRMEKSGPSAADVVNKFPETELADIIHRLGEERRARQIARAIVTARKAAPITRTHQLAAIVRRVLRLASGGRRNDKIDPATRTFQALRIFVNDELGELDRGLAVAEAMLRCGGRIAVVSFHSLEDRRVKSFLRDRCGLAPRQSRHVPVGDAPDPRKPSFKPLPQSGAHPDDDEIQANPRARSARLRAAERTDAAPWVALGAVGGSA